MNRDDIIRMAKEIGVDVTESIDEFFDYGDLSLTTENQLKRFAALLAHAERMECFRLCLEMAEQHENKKQLRNVLESAAMKIRERGWQFYAVRDAQIETILARGDA